MDVQFIPFALYHDPFKSYLVNPASDYDLQLHDECTAIFADFSIVLGHINLLLSSTTLYSDRHTDRQIQTLLKEETTCFNCGIP